MGMIFQEVGASIAVKLFPWVGPIGMVALRLSFSALLLFVLARPALKVRGATAWRTVVGFGVVLAAMNSLFYLSLERLPLGPAVTIETLGPLTLSVIAGRKWSSFLWAAVALAGILLLGGGISNVDPVGVLFALAAGAMWAGYILFSQATGAHFGGISGLAVATIIGALITVPLALTTTGLTNLTQPHVLLAGLGIAVFSSAIPYALELVALRHIAANVFAILLALAPAVATAAGFLFLGQSLTFASIVGIALVITASIGATKSHPKRNGQSKPDVRTRA